MGRKSSAFIDLGLMQSWDETPAEYTEHLDLCGSMHIYENQSGEIVMTSWNTYPTVIKTLINNEIVEHRCRKCKIIFQSLFTLN